MFDYQPTLTGDLLEMRPYEEADWEQLYAAASDPLIWEGHPTRNRHEEAVFRASIDDAVSDNNGLVARLRSDGRVVGYSRYSSRFAEPNEVEIGWTFLVRDLWGGKYNREMKRLMLAHALKTFDAVVFRVGIENYRSRGAMEKIGGVLTDRTFDVKVGDNIVVHVVYQITRQNFETSRFWKDSNS